MQSQSVSLSDFTSSRDQKYMERSINANDDKSEVGNEYEST